MSHTPKTIQIFLPSGEPHGIRIAEITTRIVQVIEVPRSLLADFLAMEQSSQVGVYVLVGEDTGDDDRRVYVGHSAICGPAWPGTIRRWTSGSGPWC